MTEQVDGKSYSDLDEASSKWIFPVDFTKTPLEDTNGSRSAANFQALPTIMILASNSGGTSTRNLTTPNGRYVFFQIVGITSYYFENDKCYPNRLF